MIAVIIDFTDRRLAEQALTERNTQLALAGRAALVGNYVYDVNKGTTHISQGYATIHGLPEGTTEMTISEWRARVHPEDLARAEGLREKAFAGFSLGGLMALDIVWKHPNQFSKAGIFSGSLWWRSIDQTEEEYDDDKHRIMQQPV